MNMHWITVLTTVGPSVKVLILGGNPGIRVASVRWSPSPSTEGKYVGRVDLPGLSDPYHKSDDEQFVMRSCMASVEAWVSQAGLGGGA